jgi:hypothetical protein
MPLKLNGSTSGSALPLFCKQQQYCKQQSFEETKVQLNDKRMMNE